MKINFQKGSVKVESGAIGLLEIYNLVLDVKTLVDSKDDLSDLVNLLDDNSDGQINTDTEKLLSEIKNSLQYNEDYTALQELSSRLELIDTRLDLEFECLNYGIGVIGSVLLAYTSMKFLSWIFRFVTC